MIQLSDKIMMFIRRTSNISRECDIIQLSTCRGTTRPMNDLSQLTARRPEWKRTSNIDLSQYYGIHQKSYSQLQAYLTCDIPTRINCYQRWNYHETPNPTETPRTRLQDTRSPQNGRMRRVSSQCP
jgi:hypothetical protein